METEIPLRRGNTQRADTECQRQLKVILETKLSWQRTPRLMSIASKDSLELLQVFSVSFVDTWHGMATLDGFFFIQPLVLDAKTFVNISEFIIFKLFHVVVLGSGTVVVVFVVGFALRGIRYCNVYRA